MNTSTKSSAVTSIRVVLRSPNSGTSVVVPSVVPLAISLRTLKVAISILDKQSVPEDEMADMLWLECFQSVVSVHWPPGQHKTTMTSSQEARRLSSILKARSQR
jgi:hypothetical protein